MKRFLPILLLAGFSSPAMADITHKLSSSVQLSVAAAATQVERIGTSYSVSGSGVDTTYTPSGGSAVTDGIGSLTISSGVGAIPTLEATQKLLVQLLALTSHSLKVMRYQVLLQQREQYPTSVIRHLLVQELLEI